MKTPILRLAAFPLIAFALGISVGYVVAPSSPKPATAQIQIASRTPSPPITPAPRDSRQRNPRDETTGTDRIADRIASIAQIPGFSRREHDLCEFCEGLGAEEIRHAMELSSRLPPSQRWQIQPSLLSRWLDLDPHGASAWIAQCPDASHREKLQREMFASLGIKNPDLGLQMLDEQKDLPGRKRGTFRNSLFFTWAAIEPNAAAEVALRLPESDRWSPLRTVLSRWAEQTPVTAIEFLDRVGDAGHSDSLRSAIIESWVQQDSDAAIAHVLALPKEQRRSSMREILKWTLDNDAGKTRELIDRIPVGRERTSFLTDLINSNAYYNAAAVAPYVLELPEHEQWSAAMSISNYFPKDDLEGSLRWAESLTSQRAASGALVNICRVWAESDPRAAAEYCFEGGEALADPLSSSIGSWTAKDPEAATKFLKTLPDGKGRDQALAAFASVLAATDPQNALASIETLARTPQQKQNAQMSAVWNWAQKDPQAAATLAFGESRAGDVSLISNVIESWAREDAPADATWLKTLPDGKARDETVWRFTSVLVQEDPAAAIDWAKSIAAPDRRHNCLQNVFQNWASKAPAAARAWLEQTTDLDEATSQRLLSSRQW